MWAKGWFNATNDEISVYVSGVGAGGSIEMQLLAILRLLKQMLGSIRRQ